MRQFLRFKHWQLFLLLYIIPLILEIIIFSSITPFDKMFFILLASTVIIFSIVFFGWFYSVDLYLHKRLPETVQMNLKLFTVFLLIPALYIFFVCVFVLRNSGTLSNENNPAPKLSGFLIPLHLFSIFCMFYCFYFIGKALKAVELQRPVTFSDFAGEFFLIWFLPIGIWILQPRINKIFSKAPDFVDRISNQRT